MYRRPERYVMREAKVVRLKELGVSYHGIAERLGLTRHAIATLLWRYRRRELRLT